MTKNTFKRVLSIVLSVAMLVTSMSFVLTAGAADTGNIEAVTINTFDNWSANVDRTIGTTGDITVSDGNIATTSNQWANAGYTYNDLLTVADGKFTISATVQTAGWNSNINYITLGFGDFGMRFINGGYTDGDGNVYALAELYKGNTLIATYTHDSNIYNEATVITYENGAISATQGGAAMAFDLASTADATETDTSVTVALDLTNVAPTVAIWCGNYSTGQKKISNYTFTANCVKNANYPTGTQIVAANSFADTTLFTYAESNADDTTTDATGATLLCSYKSNKQTATTVNKYNMGEKFIVNTLVANNVNNSAQYASITVGDLVAQLDFVKDADTSVKSATASIKYGGTTLATSGNLATFVAAYKYEMPFSLAFFEGEVSVIYNGVVVLTATIADFQRDTFSNTDIVVTFNCVYGQGTVATLSAYAYDYVVPTYAVTAAAYTDGVAGTTGGTVSSDVDLSAAVSEGTSLTLTAAANDGYTFEGWYVDAVSGTPVSTEATYTTTVTGAANYIANFVTIPPQDYRVAVNGIDENNFTINNTTGTLTLSDGTVSVPYKEIYGNVTSNGTYDLSHGAIIKVSMGETEEYVAGHTGYTYIRIGDSLIIGAYRGYIGYGWSITTDEQAAYDESGECAYPSATFVVDTAQDTSTVICHGRGNTHNIKGKALASVPYSVDYANPKSDYVITITKDGDNKYLTVTRDGAAICQNLDITDYDLSEAGIQFVTKGWWKKAEISDFELQLKIVNFNVDADAYTDGAASTVGGGVAANVDLPAVLENGSQVTLTATANTGYEFDGWYVGSVAGDPVSTEATYVATVDNDVNYIANFVAMKAATTHFSGSFADGWTVTGSNNDSTNETLLMAGGFNNGPTATSTNTVSLGKSWKNTFTLNLSTYNQKGRTMVFQYGDLVLTYTMDASANDSYTLSATWNGTAIEATTSAYTFTATNNAYEVNFNNGALTVSIDGTVIYSFTKEQFEAVAGSDWSFADSTIIVNWNNLHWNVSKLSNYVLISYVYVSDVIDAIDAVGTLISSSNLFDVDELNAVKDQLAVATSMYNSLPANYRTAVTNAADLATYEKAVAKYTVYFNKSGFAAVDNEGANLFNITVEGGYSANYDTTNVTLASPNAWGAIHATTANKYNLGDNFMASIEFRRSSVQNLKAVDTPSNDDNYYDIEIGALKGRVFFYCTDTSDRAGTLQTVFILYYDGTEIARSKVYSATELNLIGTDYRNLTLEYNNGTVVLGCDGTDYVTADVSDKNFVAYNTTVKTNMACSYAQNIGIIKSLTVVAKPAAINFTVISGAASITINGANTTAHKVTPGSTVTLVATPVAGYVFQAWVNKANDTIVSTDATVKVIANATNTYEAVCGPETAEEEQTYVVNVLNNFDKIVETKYITAGATYVLPEGPALKGYTFGGWVVNDAAETTAAGTEITINANTVIKPIYDAVAEDSQVIYTITVDGSEYTTAPYNTLVTVTTDVENFAYWTKQGVIVSYDRTYSFYAGLADDSTTIALTIAVSDAEVEAAPVTNVTNTFAQASKVTFLMERSVPSGCSLVASGFVFTKDQANFTSSDYLSLVNNDTVRKMVASETSANGQYMLTINTTSGNTIYAVSFVTYVTADGQIATTYSSVISATAQ